MRHPKHLAATASRSVRSRRAHSLVVAAGLAAVPALALVPVAAAGPPPCTVRDVTAGHHATYTGTGALQLAINGAVAGNTLKVWNTCTGDSTVTKNLTITAGGGGGATLDGTGTPGSVVTIKSGVTARINGLDITGGTGNYGLYAPIRFGGGIDNAGHLTLTNVSVVKNTAGDGGGIFNDSGAKLTLGGKSGTSINWNTANGFGGGGIYNYKGSVTSTNAEAKHNTAAGTTVIGGGGIFNHDGNLWLGSHFTSGTSVDWNVAPAGGGIYQYGTASHLTIDNGDVNHNTTTGSGGGINNQGPNTVNLLDTSVKWNAAAAGGGIYSSGKLSLTNDAVGWNKASVWGGGIFSDFGGKLLAHGVTIRGNSAGNVGGGLASNGPATFRNSLITGNSSKTGGGGLYSFNAALTLNDSAVTRNIAPFGGGIYAWGGGSVALAHFSFVNRNAATVNNGGGGIYYKAPTTLINVHPGHNVRFNKNGNVVL